MGRVETSVRTTCDRKTAARAEEIMVIEVGSETAAFKLKIVECSFKMLIFIFIVC